MGHFASAEILTISAGALQAQKPPSFPNNAHWKAEGGENDQINMLGGTFRTDDAATPDDIASVEIPVPVPSKLPFLQAYRIDETNRVSPLSIQS